MFKYLFKRDTIFATIAVFMVMGLLSLLPLNTHVLDPFKLALKDFDYDDITYARMGKNRDTPMDTNIVVVNIDTAGRQSIAAYLQKLNSFRPKVIGVDILFNGPKDPDADKALQSFFSQSRNVVQAYSLAAGHHALEPEPSYFNAVSNNNGYVNFIGEEGGVIRHFSPALKEEQQEYIPFSAAVVKHVDERSFAYLKERGNESEIINYTYRPDKFLVIDGEDLLQDGFNPQTVANKIVLVGFVSRNAADVEDKHFTPMNAKFVGKSVPDMNGVLIHANIINMMLNKAYIHKTPAAVNWIIAVLLCWLHCALFIRFFVDKHLWFHMAAKTAQLLSAVLFVYIGLLCFSQFNVKVNLTSTLVAIILTVDVLYFYEALSVWLHRKFGYESIFFKSHH